MKYLKQKLTLKDAAPSAAKLEQCARCSFRVCIVDGKTDRLGSQSIVLETEARRDIKMLEDDMEKQDEKRRQKELEFQI